MTVNEKSKVAMSRINLIHASAEHFGLDPIVDYIESKSGRIDEEDLLVMMENLIRDEMQRQKYNNPESSE